MLVGFGDESGSDRSRDPGTYILAAVLVPSDGAEALREVAESLRPPGARKAHWRSDSRAEHDRAIRILRKAEVDGVVVVRRGSEVERDERRRRKCLEVFLPLLETIGCSHVTLESRGPADDLRDRRLLDALRARKLSNALRLDHEVGPREPMLAVADALRGAIVAARTGETRWLEALGDQVQLIEVDERPAR